MSLSDKEVCVCGQYVKEGDLCKSGSYYYIEDVRETLKRCIEEIEFNVKRAMLHYKETGDFMLISPISTLKNEFGEKLT